MVKITAVFLLLTFSATAQDRGNQRTYYAGFKTLKLVDTSRLYKPNSTALDRLHYRPVDLDIWYPSSSKTKNTLTFGDLFQVFEQRANQYQDTIYTGIVEELARFYAVELGLHPDHGKKLLHAETNSYDNPDPLQEKFPLLIYMAGLNGMGFENFKILERLAESGFVVISVWSVGRYPGNMTNEKSDMMEQVYDAEFILNYLKSQNELIVDVDTIGLLACSWGGMSSAALVNRNSSISAFASLDGTESYYFGEHDEEDGYIREIHHSNILDPENKSIPYLYLESGDKLDAFSPTEEYHYYKKLNSVQKYYLRFLTGKHEDFTSIPSALQASANAVEIHNQIAQIVASFFEKHLLKVEGFESRFSKLSTSNYISTKPFDQDYKRGENILVEGKILDARTGLPLAYVNIGVLNKSIGTVSNDKGSYLLKLKSGMDSDTVRISMIGYTAKTFIVEELLSQDHTTISLHERTDVLREVVIAAKGLKAKNLGNKTTSRFISTGFGYDQLGAEVGIRINIRNNPTFMDKFNFNISYNRLSSKIVCRLNIYEIERGKPAENIMTQNVFIPIEPKQTGLISLDLRAYDIVLKEDVIATLEWVKNGGENNKGEAIFFSLGFFNSGTLIKRASQAKFKKHSNMGVGMNFDVRY